VETVTDVALSQKQLATSWRMRILFLTPGPFEEEHSMSKQSMSKQSISGFVLAISAAALVWYPPMADAQDNSKAPLESRVWHPKYAAAKDVAGLATKAFTERGFSFLAGDAVNSLIVQGPKQAMAEVVMVLEQLDRRPRSLAIELWIVHVNPGGPALEEKDWTGPAFQVEAKIQDWKKKGWIGECKRLQCYALDNHRTSIKETAQKAVVTAVNTTATGITTQTTQMRNVGELVAVLPRSTDDNQLLLKLTVEQSRLHTPADAPILGKDRQGEPIRATHIISSNLDTQVLVAPGRMIMVQGVKSHLASTNKESDLPGPAMLVLVSARWAAADKK
jgi:type II secretory pathway component GspD/PulD (secretin)